MFRLSSTAALCALALMAAPAAAQEPDWNSETNRTWWNGVTMPERGVSQLVSVDLTQAEQIVAA